MQDLQELMKTLLKGSFGPLSPQVQERLNSYSAEHRLQLGKKLPTAHSLQELRLED